MHRAQKASSKICRDREVEKAQELHRRKIDGVKSYLTAITRPANAVVGVPSVPSAKRPAIIFQRSQRQHVAEPIANQQHIPAQVLDLEESASNSDNHGDGYDDDDGDGQEDDDDSDGGLEATGDESDDGEDANELYEPTSSNDQTPVAPPKKNFDKLDELRSVLVPVMAYKDFGGHRKGAPDALNYERYVDEITNVSSHGQEPARAGLHSKSSSSSSQSLHAANGFRQRKLKQIQSDNATLFGRIRNSAAHYTTDRFKKDWDQNIAYLASICEFPVIDEVRHAHPIVPHLPPRRHDFNSNSNSNSSTRHTHRKRSPFAIVGQLPSLTPTGAAMGTETHPIKAIPTSPRKVQQLNLSPAFRSLRKGLPQAPALPPLTASPRAVLTLKPKPSMTAIASSHAGFLLHTEHQAGSESETDDSKSPSPSPSPSPKRSPTPRHHSSTTAATDAVADDALRYTLLKIGRFIGGKYLVLTVFCGDGITNPYGFDVVAVDPQSHVHFRLCITKETTHLLLETISSSSMAERTAAAAGTNLSMEMIAQCICDHVRYASLGSCELVFLVATAGNRSLPGREDDSNSAAVPNTERQGTNAHASGDHSHSTSLLLDSPYAALALCFHQCVRVPSRSDGKNKDDETELLDEQLHVFASTRPQQCCGASMTSGSGIASSTTTESSTIPEPMIDATGCEYTGLVCYEIYTMDHTTHTLVCMAQQPLQLSVASLLRQLEAARVEVDQHATARLSLDRLVMLSLPFLHFQRGYRDHQQQLTLELSRQNRWQCGTGTDSNANSGATGSPRRPASSLILPHRLDATSPASSRSSANKLLTRDDLKAVLQTGMLWRGAFLLARVSLLCPTRTIDDHTGETVRDPLDELLVFNVLNTSTGSYAERLLHGDQVDEFSLRLGAWQSQSTDSNARPSPLITFAKLLLVRLKLDVDMRGHEIITFPALEPPRCHHTGFEKESSRSSPVARYQQSPGKIVTVTEKRDHVLSSCQDDVGDASDAQAQQAVVVIHALGRGFLSRLQQQQQQQQLDLHRQHAKAEALPTATEPQVDRHARVEEEIGGGDDGETGGGDDAYSYVDSLSPPQSPLAKHRAAKRILVACRSFVDRKQQRRKHAQGDLCGLVVAKAPRSLTPTVPTTSRTSRGGGSVSATQAAIQATEQPSQEDRSTDVDAGAEDQKEEVKEESNGEEGKEEKEEEEEEEEEMEDDDDDDELVTSRHVDTLGVLHEDEPDEEENASGTPHQGQQQQQHDLVVPPEPTTAHAERSRRVGLKENGRFVLQRHSLTGQKMEHRILDIMGAFSRS